MHEMEARQDGCRKGAGDEDGIQDEAGST